MNAGATALAVRNIFHNLQQDQDQKALSHPQSHHPQKQQHNQGGIYPYSAHVPEDPPAYQPYPQPQLPPPRKIGHKRPLRTSLHEWGLPPGVVAAYQSKGVKTMFPWQAAALECGENCSNLVYCAPTSGGKSLVGEVLMIRRLLGLTPPQQAQFESHSHLRNQRNNTIPPRRALVVLPYISIVTEKAEHLAAVLRSAGLSVAGYSGTDESRQPLSYGGEAVAICTMEKANVAVNKLAQEGRLGELCCVVVDELHMIADGGRGVVLEMLLSKLLYGAAKGSMQIVGMSATMGGMDSLQEWLHARLFTTNYRPVPLQEYAVFSRRVFRKVLSPKESVPSPNCPLEVDAASKKTATTCSDLCDLEETRVLDASPTHVKDPDGIVPLVSEVTTEGHSALVFCASRRGCEAVASMLAVALPQSSRDPNQQETLLAARRELIAEIEDAAGASMQEELRMALLSGVAWHHAGLTSEERSGVEKGYRSGCISVITATSTLAAGVNLPARRVILRSLQQGPGPIERAQYLQKIGRAGRAGQSAIGEAFIIGSGPPESGKEWNAIRELLAAPVPRLVSQLLPPSKQKDTAEAPQSSHVERLLLETVASGAVKSSQDVHCLLKCTFAARQVPWPRVVDVARAALRTLACETRVISSHGPNGSLWMPSHRGTAVFDSALPLQMGLSLYDELASAQDGVSLDGPWHLIYLALCVVAHPCTICSWPMWRGVLKGLPSGRRAIAERVGVDPEYVESIIWRGAKAKADVVARHARFAAALMLGDVLSGDCSIAEAADKWGARDFLSRQGISRGELQRLQGEVSKAMVMSSMLCDSAGLWPMATLFADLGQVAAAGVRRELWPLLEIPGMNPSKARALYKAGIKSPLELSIKEPDVVGKALAAGMAQQMRIKAPKEQRGDTGVKGGHHFRPQDPGVRAAGTVAARAALGLVVAAKQYLLDMAFPDGVGGVHAQEVNTDGDHQLNQVVGADGLSTGLAAGEGASGALPPQEVTVANAARLAWTSGQSNVVELRPNTPDEDLLAFVNAWKSQSVWAIAPAVGPTSGDSSTAASKLQAFAVCWSPERVFFLDFSDRHRSRRMQNFGGSSQQEGTLQDAVASICSSAGSAKFIYDVETMLPILAAAGVQLSGGSIGDPSIGAALLFPQQDTEGKEGSLKSVLAQVAPKVTITVPQITRGVTPACKAALATLAAQDAVTKLLTARSMYDTYSLLYMAASLSNSRGRLSIGNLPNRGDIPLPRFGRVTVAASTLTLHSELVAGTVCQEGRGSCASGASVAFWATPQELFMPILYSIQRQSRARGDYGHSYASPPQTPMLACGIVIDVGSKRLQTALDFSHTVLNARSDDAVRGCALVKIKVAVIPPENGDGVDADADAPLFLPSTVELVRPADQVWRLDASSSAVACGREDAHNNGRHSSQPEAVTQCQALSWTLSHEGGSHALPSPLPSSLEPSRETLAIEILNADLAVLAHLSGDSTLQSACSTPQPWRRVCALWGIAAKQVSAPGGVLIGALAASHVVRSLFEGWGAGTLAQVLGSGVTRHAAQAAVTSFMQAFPAAAQWQTHLRDSFHHHSREIRSLGGRIYNAENASTAKTEAQKRKMEKACISWVLKESKKEVLMAAAVAVGQALGTGVVQVGNGRVLIAALESEKTEMAVSSARKALSGVVVNRRALAVPLTAVFSLGRGGCGACMHPLRRTTV